MDNPVEDESSMVACTVVALGAAAFTAVKELYHRDGRGWRLVAAGPGAAVAKADRTLLIDEGERPAAWRERLRGALEREWRNAMAVLVVVDTSDSDACTDAAWIASAARDRERATVVLMVGADPAEVDVLADAADLLLRGPDSPDDVAECLRGLLVPLDSCVMGVDYDDVVTSMRELRRGRVLVQSCRAEALRETFCTMVDPGVRHRVRWIHLRISEEGRMRWLDPANFPAPAIVLLLMGMDGFLHADDVRLFVLMTDPPVSSSCAVARLRSLVETRAMRCLPHDERAPAYAAALRQELDWWSAHEDRAVAVLELVAQVATVHAAGHITGPCLGRPGGSLIAYVLGLTAFDPIEWDLSFEAFSGGNGRVVMEVSASAAAIDRLRLPTFPSCADAPPARGWAFRCDPALDRLEEATRTRPFVWTLASDGDHEALESLPTARGIAAAPRRDAMDLPRLRRIAPTDLEELAAATVLLDPANDDLLALWKAPAGAPLTKDSVTLGAGVALTARTRGCVLYADQLTDAIIEVLGLWRTEADAMRRGFMKLSAPEWRERLHEHGRRRLSPSRLERVAALFELRAALQTSRTAALGEALTWLALTRATRASGGVRSPLRVLRGDFVIRLCGDIPGPGDGWAAALRKCTEWRAHIDGSRVRIFSDGIAPGSKLLELIEGRHFEVLRPAR